MTLKYLDLTLEHGDPAKPGIILVHGLGMNRFFWTDPGQCRALGGQGRMTLFLTGSPTPEKKGLFSIGSPDPDLTGLGTRLADEGFGLVSWSQRDALGPAARVLEEIDYAVARATETWPERPLYMIGHSRGGVLARRYLQESGNRRIVGLVTICSPHRGTRLAGPVSFFAPLGRGLRKILPKGKSGAAVEAVKRFAVFLSSQALAELKPGSAFFRESGKALPAGLRLLSFDGTDPALIRLYFRLSSRGCWQETMLTDRAARIVPDNRFPPELRTGHGDGLVSADSAVLSPESHVSVARNHVGVAFDRGVHDRIVAFLLS